MKKIIIAALVLVSATVVSCKKQLTAKTASVIEQNTSPFRKDVGTAD
ncbi:hypothetical protein [Mucilaginibacter terrenus]|nr:hypothetical protein [Mucilaginibacter terrenus]